MCSAAFPSSSLRCACGFFPLQSHTQTKHQICTQSSPWCQHPPRPRARVTLLDNAARGSPAPALPEPRGPALRARPGSLRSTSCIPHLPSCILHPASHVLHHPTSCILHPTSSLARAGKSPARLAFEQASWAEAARGLLGQPCPSARVSQIFPECNCRVLPPVTLPS